MFRPLLNTTLSLNASQWQRYYDLGLVIIKEQFLSRQCPALECQFKNINEN